MNEFARATGISQSVGYIDPDDVGVTLRGVKVSDTKFQGAASLNRLVRAGLIRPSELEHMKERDRRKGIEKESYELRESIQRRFDAARKKRAERYSNYVRAVEDVTAESIRRGGTPAITLYCPRECRLTEMGLIVPYGTPLIAIDGETQTEARFILRDSEGGMASGDVVLAFTMYHGVDELFARQILHDYNSYATPVSEKAMVTFNHEGPITTAVERAIERSGILPEKVNRIGRVAGKKHVVANQQLSAFVSGFMLNHKGLEMNASQGWVKENNRPGEPVPEQAIPPLAATIEMATSHDMIRQAPSTLWQVAGALTSLGSHAAKLNWSRAVLAYDESKQGDRGGARMGVNERIALIAEAFSTKR